MNNPAIALATVATALCVASTADSNPTSNPTNIYPTAAIALFAESLTTDDAGPAVRHVFGTVEKLPTPLLVQDRPWEPRIDNGYPNIIRQPDGSLHLFYGVCMCGCDTQALLYANASSTSHAFTKPVLHRVDAGRLCPALKPVGTANNILLRGGGIGITTSPTPPLLYGAGQACVGADGLSNCLSGVFTASDLTLANITNATALPFPPPQRYDCHTQLLKEPTSDGFLLTTRDYLTPAGRAIAISSTPRYPTPTTAPPPTLVETGNATFQLYSQITFPWAGIHLGIVMVFDAAQPAVFGHGRVHCRLAWTAARPPTSGWRFVQRDSGLTGPDFIPLGALPTPPPCAAWDNDTALSDCAAYRAGARTAHRICAGQRTYLGDNLSLAACRAACAAAANCSTIQFQGLASNAYADSRGQCFLLAACAASIPYTNPAFCIHVEHCRRAAGPATPNAFDSHICFAAAFPLPPLATAAANDPTRGRTRVYYMGGNGPHNGPRNSSLGLALLRPDGFAGIRSASSRRSVLVAASTPVHVAAATLLVTADLATDDDWLQLGLADAGAAVGWANSLPIRGPANLTRAAVAFRGHGASFAPLLGQNVTMAANFTTGVTLYAIYFAG